MISTVTRSPGTMRMKFLRILPAMWARMRWPFSSSTMNWVLGSASTIRPSVLIGSSLGTRISCDEQRRPGAELVGTQNFRSCPPGRSSAVDRASNGGRGLEVRQRAGLGSPRADPAETALSYSIPDDLNSRRRKQGAIAAAGCCDDRWPMPHWHAWSGREGGRHAGDIEPDAVNGIHGRDGQDPGVRVAPGQIGRALRGRDDAQQLAMRARKPRLPARRPRKPCLARSTFIPSGPPGSPGSSRAKTRLEPTLEASRGLDLEGPDVVSRRVADVESLLIGRECQPVGLLEVVGQQSERWPGRSAAGSSA